MSRMRVDLGKGLLGSSSGGREVGSGALESREGNGRVVLLGGGGGGGAPAEVALLLVDRVVLDEKALMVAGGKGALTESRSPRCLKSLAAVEVVEVVESLRRDVMMRALSRTLRQSSQERTREAGSPDSDNNNFLQQVPGTIPFYTCRRCAVILPLVCHSQGHSILGSGNNINRISRQYLGIAC